VVRIAVDENNQKQISDINNHLHESISSLKCEIEDHLTAINENTNEIESNYELIAEIAIKLEKIEQRLETIEIALDSQNIEKQEIDDLNNKEEKIFLTIYKEEKNYLTYSDIAAIHNFSESTARHYVDVLIKKGVPIIKKAIDGRMHFKLNPYFRELQTKHNIVHLQPQLTLRVFDQNI